MTAEEKMNKDEQYKYLRMMRRRYRNADRKTKGKLLDEMQSVLGMRRKSLIRLMNGSLIRKKRKRERGRTYGRDVDDALRVIYETYDGICPERLTPNLVSMARQLARHGELRTTRELLDQLDRISISTVQRILNRIRQDQPRLPRGRPKRGRGITRGIPMKRLSWKIARPGSFESDLVHHCGPSASGEYLYTIQWIDVATGWSERRAVLGRSALVIEDAFIIFLARLPFPVLEIHPDNGLAAHASRVLQRSPVAVLGPSGTRRHPVSQPSVSQERQSSRRAEELYAGPSLSWLRPSRYGRTGPGRESIL